ncbi:iron chelate uptake ABC transporter family permease subunit, partial [Escherichia coli]|uniref:iron chelate uptake ABC transporter family permease subunit n=1 Tax=Escherichia coli TaxID=562 RepID=UPI0014859950
FFFLSPPPSLFCMLFVSVGAADVGIATDIGFLCLSSHSFVRLVGLTFLGVYVPGGGLAGGGELLRADVVARLELAAAALPIGVVTATLGAPVFIWLLLK